MSKTVLITGAARRIGRALALHFAAHGWQVAAHYHHSGADANSLQAEHPQAIRLFAQDLAEPDAGAHLLHCVTAAMGPVDVLINNAALFENEHGTPTATVFAATMAVNLFAPMQLTHAFMQGGGKTAMTMLDATLHLSWRDFPSYVTSKTALASWVEKTAWPEGARHYGLLLGPVMRNPRESQETFQANVEKMPAGKPTDLSRILSTVDQLLETRPEQRLHDLA